MIIYEQFILIISNPTFYENNVRNSLIILFF